MKEHINSIKNHVKQLSDKGYADIEEIGSPDFIFIFVPIDSALSLALSHDWNVQELANKNKIAFMTPIHLISILKMTAYMWRVDKQSKTIKDIASAASDIYDKTVSVYESFVKANQSLDLAKTKMDEAKLRLQDGSGSLSKKVEKMKKLGRLSTKKQLPDNNENVIE